MATKVYKPKRKISATESEEIKIPASSVDGLSTVATSGSYNDLSDKPTIPSVPTNYVTTDTAQTISGAKTFTAQPIINTPNGLKFTSGNCALRIYNTSASPTDYSAIEVRSNSSSTNRNLFIDLANNSLVVGQASGNADTTYKVNVKDSFNATTIYENGTSLANKYLGKTAKAADADKLDGNDSTYYLNYDNLSNKPTIPTKTSQLTNDSGYTTNKGTVTQVKINGATKSPDSAGLVDLGTVGGGGATDAVKYTPQTLTASQKTQARSNIGAGTGNGTVTGVKINGSTKGTSGVVDLGYIKVKVNGTTYTADSSGLIDLGTISGGGTVYANIYNDIY